MDKYSYVSNAHASYIDELYLSYKADPASVDESWQQFFEGFDFSIQKYGEKKASNGNGAAPATATSSNGSAAPVSEKEIRVHYLIHAYRSRG